MGYSRIRIGFQITAKVSSNSWLNLGNLTSGGNTYIILFCLKTFDDDDDCITKALVDGVLKYQSLVQFRFINSLSFNTPGNFINQLNDYDIVIPTKVDKDGAFISHVVHHDVEEGDAGGPSNIQYKIPVFGKELHLTLTRHEKFIAPGFVVQEGTSLRQHNHKCHFSGRLKDQTGSTVFVSNCRGLVSIHMSRKTRDKVPLFHVITIQITAHTQFQN